jgi:hypothetical protein
VKKRGKKHWIKPVNVPMMTSTRNDLAIEMRLAIKGLIGAPSIDSCNQLSLMLAALTQAGSCHPALDAATEAVNSVVDRYERVKKIGVSDKEADILEHAAGGLDALLGTIPINVFRAANGLVKANFKKLYEAGQLDEPNVSS